MKNEMHGDRPGRMSPNTGIQVIARATAVLRTLKDYPEGLSLGQIAQVVNLPRSTVQRIINALLNERLVMSVSPHSGYRLGPEIQSLAAVGRTDVVEIVRPYIMELSRTTGETVDLAEFRHDYMVCIDQVSGTHRLRAASAVGEAFPVLSAANGKASLALLDDDLIAQLYTCESARSQYDKKNLCEFMQEIRQIRREGVAYDLDEHSMGVSAVGGAFMTMDEVIYAVSVPVPTPRFIENRESLVSNLLSTINCIKGVLDLG